MARFICRNYGKSRQVDYKGKQLCLSNDQAIETDDAGEAAALEAAGQIHVADRGVEYATPIPPEKPKTEKPKTEKVKKKKRKVTVDNVEAVHQEKFPNEDEQQETGGTQPPLPETKAKDEISYSDMTVKELRVLAEDRTPPIKTSGVKKAELVQALIAYDSEG